MHRFAKVSEQPTAKLEESHWEDGWISEKPKDAGVEQRAKEGFGFAWVGRWGGRKRYQKSSKHRTKKGWAGAERIDG